MKSFNSRRAHFVGAIAFCCGILLAANFSYGDFIGADFTFTDLSETFISTTYVPDDVHTFGTPYTTGNKLAFNGTNFSSITSGIDGVDMTDGKLDVTIVAHPGKALTNLKVYESGAYHSLPKNGGAGTTATVAMLGATLEIMEVDGVPVNLPLINGTMVFADPANPPPQPDTKTFQKTAGKRMSGNWAGNMVFNNIGQYLDNTMYEGKRVTKARLVFDNILATNTDAAGVYSYIDKKRIEIIPTLYVPEPALLLMFVTGAVVLGIRWRKKADA
ncbi:MAG: hypothetical protein ACWGMZ_05355 [Thermoguttaceae bacterium]